MKTAEEFYLQETGWDSIWEVEEFDKPHEVLEYMKAFAKYHVKLAMDELKEGLVDDGYMEETDTLVYNLNNIK